MRKLTLRSTLVSLLKLGHPFSATMPHMRFRLAVFFFTAFAAAQSGLRFQSSHTAESLRGVSAVSRKVAWASGTHGTYLRTTNGGETWIAAQVPDATAIDFRGVVAFSADEAFLMSSGPGEQSRIYHTADGGQHWKAQFTNSNPKGFFDSIAFWDAKHGVVLGDPIPDESGKLRFEVLFTDDGQTWQPIPPSRLPEALDGEGAFAASNTCIAILPVWGRPPSAVQSGEARPSLSPSLSDPPDPNIWFATGGKVARVFHSPDRGKTWEVFSTPIAHGSESAGIFSIAFRDRQHGVIAGGDYKQPQQDGPNLAFTEDGGKTWKLSDIRPKAYFSAVAYEPAAIRERLLLIAQDFVLDSHPPSNPQRISGKKEEGFDFNAVSAGPGGEVLIVGPKGIIAAIP